MTGAEIVVRPLQAGEEDKASALWHACGLIRPWNDPLAEIVQARKSGCAAVLVAVAGDGRIVASAMAGDDGHRGWMYYVAAEPALRGTGLGRRMVKAAENWLRHRGIAKAQLIIRGDNAKVRGFYEALGYGVQDRVLMARWLDGRPLTP